MGSLVTKMSIPSGKLAAMLLVVMGYGSGGSRLSHWFIDERGVAWGIVVVVVRVGVLSRYVCRGLCLPVCIFYAVSCPQEGLKSCSGPPVYF